MSDLVNPRTERTLENIADSIGQCSVRCGGCSFASQPCAQCVLLSKLANWHTPKQNSKWQKELAALRANVPKRERYFSVKQAATN